MSEWTPKVRRVSSGEDKAKLAFLTSLLSEGRFEEAAAEASKVLETEERSFSANMAMGRALQGQKKYEDSLVYFKRAAEIDPMQATAHLMVGMSAFLSSDYPLAEERFQVAVNIDPKSAPGYLGLAQLQFRRGENDTARENVDRALELSPDLAPAMLLRARILAKGGDSGEAIEQLNHVLRTDPGNRQAILSLAAAHMQDENYAEAESRLVQALEQRADDPIINGFLGRVRLRLNDFVGAETATRASMQNLPKRQQMGRSLQLAEALIGQKRFDEAKKLLDSSPKFGPMAAMVNARLGDLYLAQGAYQQSVAYYRAALLQTTEGDNEVRQLDAAMANEDPVRRAEMYRQAAEERQQAARKAFAEQDWQSSLDKYRPVIAQFMETWRGGEAD
ncbi:MAG: tetratricopeptide repeat protein [Parvularculaceae bacterium]